MKRFLFINAIILSSCANANAEDVEITGIWANERGSAVTFTEADGLLSGYYNTQLGNPDPAARFPLTGFIEGDQVTFTVNFKGYGSLTSWTGQMSEDADGPYIRTLWHLTRDVPDAEEDDDLWSSIIAGNAVFRPITAFEPQKIK
ncbi:avidin/streptavidin family protein [Litorimonas sp. WD9-15]|uniref:avidin/streptavidin family protein n=1 Tax=Litorimonas sp. WD9-15 TaxID=3418716 RepID=UPI003CFC30ED